MAEGARLESVYTLKGIEGSNPSLSANRTNFINEVGFFVLELLKCLEKTALCFRFYPKFKKQNKETVLSLENRTFFIPIPQKIKTKIDSCAFFCYWRKNLQ